MPSTFIPIESRLKKRGFKIIAGIDEAGRGPIAGPVVSAAVILKPHQKLPGLKDSKLLTKPKREHLFELITRNAIEYSISIVSHKTIDQINIAQATRFANHCCVKFLKNKPDIALIDGRDKQIVETEFLTIIKGDRFIKSIAAASVLAKVARDRIMTFYAEKYPHYGFEKHMGYGTRKHRANYVKYGPCQIHRKTFKFN